LQHSDFSQHRVCSNAVQEHLHNMKTHNTAVTSGSPHMAAATTCSSAVLASMGCAATRFRNTCAAQGGRIRQLQRQDRQNQLLRLISQLFFLTTGRYGST
jgi:hypothetical protein